jgi:hypothetical protein
MSKPESKPLVTASSTVQTSHQAWFNNGGQTGTPSVAQRSAGPWLPQPWKSAQAEPAYQTRLSDQHVIVVSTLTLILVGVIVLLLAT